MDKTEGLMEQPLEIAEEETSVVESDAASEGSMYGKFKDATSLFAAYKNLEAEFTRKSQKVAALEKLVSESEDASKKIDNVLTENSENGSSENASKYAYQREDWKSNVEDFFKANPEAAEYKSRMSRILHENPEYSSSPKCLELAYKLAKAEGLKRPAELLKDQQFIEEYVLGDEHIRDLIITDYISSLSRGALPKVISGTSKVQVAPPKALAPKTIKEAGMLAQKYLG